MYYMAVPPFLYAGLCSCLRSRAASAAVSLGCESLADCVGVGPAPQLRVKTSERFVLEKPFGRDTASCAKMVRELSMLSEDEIYRIDHYLGKELVMNLLVLRFANVAFQSIWNRQCIKSVQIIFKEDFGTEGRGGYFDQYGIIRDVMQNHLLQVAALVAMEQPLDFTAESIMAEKLKILKACGPLTMEDLVVGQYVRCGKHPGYLEDTTISNKDSNTETFAAGVLHIHTPRWDGVPFVLKAGKALTDRKAEVRIQFQNVPGAIPDFKDCAANELVVQLQPQQTIYWKVINKVPGLKFQVQQMRMDLVYASKFDEKRNPMPEAYERLLLESFAGDHSHFVSAKELEASWRIFTPILQELHDKQIKPLPYPYGSRGPPAADALAHKYGLQKFGGGMSGYVHGGAVKALAVGDEADNTTSNSASAALRTAAATSLMQSAAASEASAGGGSDLASARATPPASDHGSAHGSGTGHAARHGVDSPVPPEGVPASTTPKLTSAAIKSAAASHSAAGSAARAAPAAATPPPPHPPVLAKPTAVAIANTEVLEEVVSQLGSSSYSPTRGPMSSPSPPAQPNSLARGDSARDSPPTKSTTADALVSPARAPWAHGNGSGSGVDAVSPPSRMAVDQVGARLLDRRLSSSPGSSNAASPELSANQPLTPVPGRDASKPRDLSLTPSFKSGGRSGGQQSSR